MFIAKNRSTDQTNGDQSMAAPPTTIAHAAAFIQRSVHSSLIDALTERFGTRCSTPLAEPAFRCRLSEQ